MLALQVAGRLLAQAGLGAKVAQVMALHSELAKEGAGWQAADWQAAG